MQASLADVARRLRSQAALTEPPYSTHAIIEHAFPDALVTGADLPMQVHEAVSRTETGVVLIYRRSLTIPEQRVAIAHGVGHLVFDMHQHVTGFVREAFRERRADAVAAELLVPLDDLAPRLRCLPSRVAQEQQIYLDHVDELAGLFAVPARLIRDRIRLLITSAH